MITSEQLSLLAAAFFIETGIAAPCIQVPPHETHPLIEVREEAWRLWLKAKWAD